MKEALDLLDGDGDGTVPAEFTAVGERLIEALRDPEAAAEKVRQQRSMRAADESIESRCSMRGVHEKLRDPTPAQKSRELFFAGSTGCCNSS